MEIRVLRYFLAVAREETITGAAEILHVTQPTLSKQLMDLENELGKQLFIRGNRKITLTEDGLYFRKRAQEIIDLVNKTESELSNSTEQISGEISIGAAETESMRFISKIIKKLQKNYPDIHYNLFSGNIDSVSEKLDKGLLDFGIFVEPFDLSKFNSIKLPNSDYLCLMMRKDSPLANKDFIVPKDLYDIPLIVPTRTSNNPNFLKWLGRDVENLNIVAIYNLIYNASLLVEEGFGYAICIDRLIPVGDNSNLTTIPLKPDITLSPIFVWKKYQVFSKTSQKFLDELKKEINTSNELNI